MKLIINNYMANPTDLILIGVICGAIIAGYIYLQNEWVEVEKYKIGFPNLPKSFEGFKIVHVSDTQFPYNASSTRNLLALIRKQKPDLIVMTGDMIDRRGRDLVEDGTVEFCRELVKISEVYAITGNHEYTSPLYEEWKNLVKSSGICLLINEHVIFEKNNEKIALLGLDVDVPFHEDLFRTDLNEVKDMPRILLSHKPNLNKSFESDKNSIRPHLVLSGHAHGGQFRVPFWRGLYSPDQGVLPKYTFGLYQLKNNVRMLVSRGLGNSSFPFRLNNRPHMPVIILKRL
ncbi:MAG: ykuE1 [Bacillales bacterium]|jgi:predicted MPP superfamily phosphohydrolase|nr:ykuE1 [Bacillales bacterium]